MRYINYLEWFCTWYLLFFLIYLFIQSFIYIGMDTWIFILYYFVCFVAYAFIGLAIRSSYRWPLCSFDRPLLLCCFVLSWLSAFLLSVITRCPRLIFYIFHTSPRINHLSKESCFFLLENGVRNWDPGIRHVCCYWGHICFSFKKTRTM